MFTRTGNQDTAPSRYGIIDTTENKVSDETDSIMENFPQFIQRPPGFRTLSKLNIVLDLDETLIHTFDKPITNELTTPEMNNLRNRLFEFKVVEPANRPDEEANYIMNGIKRPGLNFFLIFCLCYFKNVIIWSAAEPRYVRKIVDIIFRDMYPPLAVYTRDSILISPEGMTIKPLTRIYDDEKIEDEDVNERNTIVIDDKMETFIQNMDNGIQIPPYDPSPVYSELVRDDLSLFQLTIWLYNLLECGEISDIRDINKSRVFLDDINLDIVRRCKVQNGRLSCIDEEILKLLRKLNS